MDFSSRHRRGCVSSRDCHLEYDQRGVWVGGMEHSRKEGLTICPPFGMATRSRLGRKHRGFIIGGIGRVLHLGPPGAWSRQILALGAFRQLGPLAGPALPRIIPLLRDPELADVAIYAILSIRPERERDVLSLTNALSLHGADVHLNFVHCAAILALSTFGHKASGAVPVLLPYLQSTNDILRGAAATTLVRIGASPQSIVPLIAMNLPQTNVPISLLPPFPQSDPLGPVLMNLWALGECGKHARMALPIITNLYSYPVDNVRRAARKAAAKITVDTNSVRSTP